MNDIDYCETNYNPKFFDREYVDIWDVENKCWKDGGIIWGSMVSVIDNITHNYFVVFYEGIVYTDRGSLRHNGQAEWIEEKYLRIALSPKID